VLVFFFFFFLCLGKYFNRQKEPYRIRLLVILVGSSLASPDATRPSGSDQTDLATGGSVSPDGRCMTNMLMITTTVRMFDGIHGNTTHCGPAISLRLILVISATGLQDGLVDTTTTRDNSNHSAIGRWNNLLGAGWKLDAGLLGVGIVSDNGSVVTGSTGKSATIARLLFQVADNGTFGHAADGKNIADLQSSTLSTVDKLSGVHSFGGQEKFLALLEAIRILENDYRQRGTTTGVMDNFLNDTLDVSLSLGKVDGPQFGGPLAMLVVRLEDASCSLTLGSDNSSHCSSKVLS